MAQSAFQTQYSNEWIAGFEKRQSLLRHTCTTEVDINGDKATFLVADSGGATAVSRGLNGKIPTRPDNLTQPQATLAEWHDIPERTGFNIFASQGPGIQIMQQTCQTVINRKIDEDIGTALNAATVTWGAAAATTMVLISKAKTKLGNAFALQDAQVWARITPAFHAYLMSFDQFVSVDYVSGKPFEGVGQDTAFNWYGVNWIVDGGIPGAGTSNSQCIMYSQKAIGHAVDMTRLTTYVDYDTKNDLSWARCSAYMGSKLLQNAGVVKMPHDDSALS